MYIDIFNLLLRRANPTITSLKFAIENEQVKMIQALVSKIPSYKIVELIQQLEEFCELLIKLKQKDLSKNDKSASTKKVNTLRFTLLKSLSDSDLDDQTSKARNSSKSKVEEEFTCPVCKELMLHPLKIFACSGDHLICSDCLVQVTSCSICRQDYTKVEPSRRYKAESFISDYMSELSQKE